MDRPRSLPPHETCSGCSTAEQAPSFDIADIVQRLSVHIDSLCEIDKYKWIESEQAGYDLGEDAVRRWIHEHWRGYLRARWLEHLHGTRFWIELDRGDYGLLKRTITQDHDLLIRILDMLKRGEENLSVINWAHNSSISSEAVLHILEVLDINSRRLQHQFEYKHACGG